ncbi:IS3 family transposase, partial [Nonomuraea zeae]
EQVLAVLDSPRFADKSPGQVWAILLDEGVYLCSQPTMYRLLRERGQNGERRAQAVRPPTSKPELEADRPNLVWS